MNEDWRPVVGYEGLYEVSSLGQVRSLARDVVTTAGAGGKPRVNRRKERLLRPTYRKGYACVDLCRAGRNTATRVNRIVLTAFVGPPTTEARFACHKDDNRERNNLENLYWGTPQQNMDDCVANGNRPRGEDHCEGKLTDADVREIRRRLAGRQEMQAQIAAAFQVNQTLISAIKTGKAWGHVT